MSLRQYHIPVTISFARDAAEHRSVLAQKFTDAYRVFMVRMSKFSNLHHVPTAEESLAISIMFQALRMTRAELDAFGDSTGEPVENIDA